MPQQKILVTLLLAAAAGLAAVDNPSDAIADDLIARYANFCGLHVDETHHTATYIGLAGPPPGVHLLLYSYEWEVLPGNIRGGSSLLVFAPDHAYLGEFQLYDPTVALTIIDHGATVEARYPRETPQNSRISFDFSSVIPSRDSDHGGSYFESFRNGDYRSATFSSITPAICPPNP